MVQFNKKIINNTIELKQLINSSIELKKMNGGSLVTSIYELSFVNKLLLLIIILIVISYIIHSFFRFKLNGLIIPIVLGFIGIEVYKLLMRHITTASKLVYSAQKKSKNKIVYVITNFKSILYSLPDLVPNMPQVIPPNFNNNPFKNIREGIQSLKINFEFKESDYKLSINFPETKIPYPDPVAGICCVWEQFEKLLNEIKKLLDKGPKKLVDKAFKAVEKIINLFKQNVIDPIIDSIKNISKGIGTVIKGTITGFVGFLNMIKELGIDGLDDFITTLNNTKSKIENMFGDEAKIFGGESLNGFITTINNIQYPIGNMFGNEDKTKTHIKTKIQTEMLRKKKQMSKYEKQLKETNKIVGGGTLNYDIFYNIDLLNNEEKFKKKYCEKIFCNMCNKKILKIHKKYGIIQFANMYKTKKFKNYLNRKLKQRSHIRHKNTINEPIINNTVSDNKINKNILVLENNNKNSNNLYKQKGGDPISDAWNKLQNAIKMVNKIVNIIADLPNKLNPSAIINKIVNSIPDIINKIEDIGKKIAEKIPKLFNFIKALIQFVGKMIAWVAVNIFKKGARILMVGVDLVRELAVDLPFLKVGEAIFQPIKDIFDFLQKLLKLPFEEFFNSIVDILNKIPEFFNDFMDSIKSIMKEIENEAKKKLESLKAVWEEIKRTAEAAYKRLKWLAEEAARIAKAAAEAAKRAAKKVWGRVSGFGGGSLPGLNILYHKHLEELHLMIIKKNELEKYNKTKYNKTEQLLLLNKLIDEKREKIKNIKNVLLEYKNTSKKTSNNTVKNEVKLIKY